MGKDIRNSGIFDNLLLTVTLVTIVAAGGFFGLRWYLNPGGWCQTPRPNVKSNMRSMATAIESYLVDNNRYPPHTFDPAYKAQWHSISGAPTFDVRVSLTTPIAYISEYPEDPFHNTGNQHNTFAYWSASHGWVLVLMGPDADFDIPFHALSSSMTYVQTMADGTTQRLQGSQAVAALFQDCAYDTTNGSLSSGDIFHFASGDLSFSWLKYVPQPPEDAE